MAGQRQASTGADRRPRHHGGAPCGQSRSHPPHQSRRHSSPTGPAGTFTICLSHGSGVANPVGPRSTRRGDYRAGPSDQPPYPAQEPGMTDFSPHHILPLLLWGTLVGLDLVSVPQAMISRPIVAGIVAGLLAGDVQAGIRTGALLELFALDVLPAGAARYPDYGPATVAAVALAVGTPWELGLGVSSALGLVLAVLGGWSLQVVRRWNARAIQRRAAALAAGESSAIRRLQYGGVLRDALRGFILTLLGLVLASAVTESV